MLEFVSNSPSSSSSSSSSQSPLPMLAIGSLLPSGGGPTVMRSHQQQQVSLKRLKRTSPIHSNKASPSSATSTTSADSGSDDGDVDWTVESKESKCQLCSRRPTQTTCLGVKICLTCNKFMTRQRTNLDPQKITKIECKNGGYIHSSCDLKIDRSCTKCRLIRFAELKIQVDNDNASFNADDDLTKRLVEISQLKTVKMSKEKESARVMLREKLLQKQHNNQQGSLSASESGSSPETDHNQPSTSSAVVQNIPSTPSDHSLSRLETMRWDVMLRQRAYSEVQPVLTYRYLESKISPNDDSAFWIQVKECIENLAKYELPIAVKLAGGLTTICPFDMCRLVESSYALVFYAETGLPHGKNIEQSFRGLFIKMSKAWPEIIELMQATGEVVKAIQAWAPSKDEFALLTALIICNSVNEKSVSQKTSATLKILDATITCAAQGHLIQQCRHTGLQRFQALLEMVDRIKVLRDTRRNALKRFYLRNRELALSTVIPVVATVCEHFRDQWQTDYLSPEGPPCLDTQTNQMVWRSGVHRIAEQILETL